MVANRLEELIMKRYNLRRDDESHWQVVDSATTRTAELDGKPMKRLNWIEACDMVSLLNCLDAIESASRDYEALVAAE